MDHQTFIDAYHRAFLHQKEQPITPFQFGEAVEALTILVLKGIKRGTASLHAVYAKANEPVPKNHETFLMCDHQNNPKAILKNTAVDILPYQAITASHAKREGEGDGSLSYWRNVHQKFFTKEATTYDVDFNETSLVIFEAFECVFQHPHVPVFESEHLRMRPFAQADAQTLLRWWQDPEVMRHVGFPNGLDIPLESVRKTIYQSNTEQGENPRRFYAICEKASGRAIGEISYDETDTLVGEKRIGIKLCEADARGKGLGKEALQALIGHLFDTIKVHTVRIDTLHTNTRAQALYERIGAKKESIKKAFWTNPEGTVFDAVFYRLTKADFIKTL